MLARPFFCVAVANRGEAAVRFMRAARSWSRERGVALSVIALYTHADAALADRRKAEEDCERVLADVTAGVHTAVAREFDAVHNVARALEVGSLDALMTAKQLRPTLCARLEHALEEDQRAPAAQRPGAAPAT